MAVNNNQIRDKIYNDLRSQIFNNELQYGDRLVESQIAEFYHVNKAHVREVLLLLQADDLVEHIPMKGFVVLGISREDLLEIAKIREMLESAIFEDFLANASDEDLEEGKRLTKRKIAFLEAGLKEDAFKETCAFFTKVYECTSYHHMVTMLRRYRDYIDFMITQAFDLPDDVTKTIKNSNFLYEVLDKRDYQMAQEWIHIRYVNIVYKISQSPARYPSNCERQIYRSGKKGK